MVFHYDAKLLIEIGERLGGLEEREYSFNGYTNSAGVLSYGKVGWTPERPSQGICLDLPASALGMLEEEFSEFLEWVYTRGGRCSRLDIALDDYEGLLDMRVIESHLEAGRLVSCWRSWKPEESARAIDPTKREKVGKTLYIGSKKSDRYVRFYDKLAERKARGAEVGGLRHWVRFELQSRGDRACAVFDEMVEGLSGYGRAANRVGEYLAEYVYGLLDFKELECSTGDTNKFRQPTVEWWAKFLEVGMKTRIVIPKRKQDIETVKRLWEENIAVMAALLLSAPKEHAGYEWVMASIAEGARRFGPRHKLILRECGTDLEFLDTYTDEELREMGIVLPGEGSEYRQADLLGSLSV